MALFAFVSHFVLNRPAVRVENPRSGVRADRANLVERNKNQPKRPVLYCTFVRTYDQEGSAP